jgi:HAE1 family hydrophobic/amphiphilic exporter-1
MAGANEPPAMTKFLEMVTMMTRNLATLTVLAHFSLAGVAPAQAQQQPPATPPAGPVVQISMEQAEAMALESNLQLKADRLDPAAAAEDVASARAVFKPTLGSSVTRGSSQSLLGSAFEGDSSTISRTNVSASTSLSQQLPWYGGNYRLSFNAGRSETSQLGARFNPSLSSSLQFSFTQPLLSGFRIDGQRANLETVQRRRSIADVQLDERIVRTRVQAQLAYLALIGAIERRTVSQLNLDLANQQLRDNQARVEVGTMAPIDIVQAEAEVANREEAVIRADADIATAEDSLRTLILDPGRADYWQVRFEPTEAISLQERTVDIDAAIATALRDRTELIVARSQMEITDLNLRATKNSTLPSVNLQVQYSATGSGGTENFFTFLPGIPPVLDGSVERGFGAVVGDSFRNNLPAWSVGLNASYPIGKSSAEANMARQRIQRQQQEVNLRAIELGVVNSVRTVARELETNFKRVEVTQLARERARRQLDAEEKRFAVGLSSTFELQSRQRDLATARNNELTAMIDYNRSLIQFDAIQKAPVR